MKTVESAAGAPADPRKGYLYLAVSVILVAAGVHLTRAALELGGTAVVVSLAHVLATCLVFSCLGIAWRAAGWKTGEIEKVSRPALGDFFRRRKGLFLPASLAISLSGWVFNQCLAVYGAEMTAFLANLTFVFLVFSGWAAGEKARPVEAASIAVMVTGAFVFSYHGGGVAWGALGMMFFVCAVTAGKQVIVKNASGDSPLPVVMSAVMLFSIPWSVLLLLLPGQWRVPGPGVIALAFASGVTTSVAGMTLLYRAYHLVGIARGASFNTLRPLAVLLIGLLLGHAPPTASQAAGGAMILAGSFFLVARKNA